MKETKSLKKKRVLIVGAPNVGKSTLFNRLIRERKSIVYSEPGVTRDMVSGECFDERTRFTVTDTGGLIPGSSEQISEAVQRLVERAVRDSLLTLLVTDSKKGVTSLDEQIALFLRKSGARVLLCVNKIDLPTMEELLFPFYALGLGEPLAVSAEHGLGIQSLINRIAEELEQAGSGGEEEATGRGTRTERSEEIRIVIAGRQNVGKSSLLNALLDDERMIVSEIPGTTVDSVDSLMEWQGKKYIIVDTAGIRKKKRARGLVEKIAVIKARQNIQSGDIILLVLDVAEGLTAQDIAIAGYANEHARPLLILFNKWDLMKDKQEAMRRMNDQLSLKLRFLKSLPLLPVSALTGAGVRKILPAADLLFRKYTRKISTAELNRLMLKVARTSPIFSSLSSQAKLFYIVQSGIRPQRFIVFTKNVKSISASQRRYLENLIREKFDLSAIPVRVEFRERRKESLKRKNK